MSCLKLYLSLNMWCIHYHCMTSYTHVFHYYTLNALTLILTNKMPLKTYALILVFIKQSRGQNYVVAPVKVFAIYNIGTHCTQSCCSIVHKVTLDFILTRNSRVAFASATHAHRHCSENIIALI